MSIGIGVPMKLLQEAQGSMVTLESFSGEKYRGELVEIEENMNCQMIGVIVTYPNGKTEIIENIYVRGNKIKSFLLPNSLKNSSLFKRQGGDSGKPSFPRGRGRGRGNPCWGGSGGSSSGSREYSDGSCRRY